MYVPAGYAPARAQTEARHAQEIANERMARARGMFEQLDRGVSTEAKLRVAVHEAGRAMFHRRGGYGLELYAGRMRVGEHAIMARREPAFARARALGLHVPAIGDRHRGQETACWYTVLAVGSSVRGVRVGDAVLASCWIGDDLGRVMGTDVYMLYADGYPCDLDLRWDEPISHGTLDAAAMGCRCGGDILAVRGTA